MLTQLANLKRRFQFTVFDLGTGLHRLMERLVAPSDLALMVTTTEPPSLAEAYASIKYLSKMPSLAWEVLINQAASANEAESIFQRLSQTTRAFLQTELGFAGWIPQDPHIPQAVRARSPLLVEHSRCAAAVAIKQLIRRLLDLETDSHTFTQISHSHVTRDSSGVAQETLATLAAH